jgi:hypothetical protein
MALAPQTTYLKVKTDGADALAVSTFETSRATVELGGATVLVEQQSEITSYPATMATDSAGLRDGPDRAFTVRLLQPVKAMAIRVIGRPACGDNPKQAFSSCGELEAFGE